jgi:glycopeptide antibiotics resistance protein
VRGVPTARHLAVIALAYTAFAVYGSLVPLDYRPVPFAAAIEQFRHMPRAWMGIGARADWGANILLFIPLTFFWMAVLTCDRGRVGRTIAALALVPIASAASMSIEFTQIWFVGRTPSVGDILAESIGGATGIALWLIAGPQALAWLREFSGDARPGSRLRWLLQAYLIGLIGYSVVPLDLTISVTDLYHKYTAGSIVLVPFSYAYESASTAVYQFFADIAEFVPVGALVALTIGSRGVRVRPIVTGVIGGAAIAAAIEFAQLLVLSRFADTTDIVLGAIGAAIGGWLVERMQPASSRSGERWSPPLPGASWLAAILVYSLFLVGGFLFPFDISLDRASFVTRLDGFFRVPFYALYWGSELNATSQLLIRLLLFAPIGALWSAVAAGIASRPGRRMVLLFGIGYAAALALGIELVQIAMPSKVADITEVGLATVGAIAGQLFARALTQTALRRPRHGNVVQ